MYTILNKINLNYFQRAYKYFILYKIKGIYFIYKYNIDHLQGTRYFCHYF